MTGTPEQSSFRDLWRRLPSIWKVVTVIGAVAWMGFTAGMAWSRPAAITRAELEKHAAGDVDLREQVRQLREADRERAESIRAIRQDTSEVKQDVRTLLQYMLERPPVRHAVAKGTP